MKKSKIISKILELLPKCDLIYLIALYEVINKDLGNIADSHEDLDFL